MQNGSISSVTAPTVDDIVDVKAYSIEEAKQKVAMDKKMKGAEAKKMDERRIIRKLRTEFEQLLAEVGVVYIVLTGLTLTLVVFLSDSFCIL